MKKSLALFITVLSAVFFAGCGHNAIHYGDGIGFDAGINPENWTASFTLRYGKILSAVTRDNVEMEITGRANANGDNGGENTASAGVATDGNFRVKIGRQINGAAVDLVEAGADPAAVLETLK